MLDDDEEDMTSLSESDPLVRDHRDSIPLKTKGSSDKEMTVQEILDTAKFSFIDVMFLVALGLIGIADSMQACYIAIVLPVLK